MPNVNFAPTLRYDYADLNEAFPVLDPGQKPLGSKVLVQLRKTKKKTKSGIYLSEDSREADQWNTQVAKVIEVGAVAFKNRESLKDWPEGNWCQPGDFVRIPKYRTDTFQIKDKDGDPVLFAFVNDLEIVAKITCDPRDIMTFI